MQCIYNIYAARQGMRSVYLYAARQGMRAGIYAARQGMRACSKSNRDVALIPCVVAYTYILHLFPTFWHCHPYIFQHFNGNVFTLLFHWFFVA